MFSKTIEKCSIVSILWIWRCKVEEIIFKLFSSRGSKYSPHRPQYRKHQAQIKASRYWKTTSFTLTQINENASKLTKWWLTTTQTRTRLTQANHHEDEGGKKLTYSLAVENGRINSHSLEVQR